MHSIRTKITAITLAALLTTILSVFVVGFTTIRAENDRRSVEMMNLLCQDTQKALETNFESVEQSVEMAANLAGDSLDSVTLVESGAVGSSGATGAQARQLDAYLEEYCAGIESAFSSVAKHTHGVVSYYYCIDSAISKTVHGFFYSKVGRTGFDRQEPIDVSLLDPEDPLRDGWYAQVVQRGRPCWVGPYTEQYLNQMPVCSYLVPIYKSGALIGVLGMDIPVELLVSRVSPIRVYETGFACLLDANGRTIYHPELPTGSLPELNKLSISEEMFDAESNGDNLIRYTAAEQRRQMSFTTLANGMKLVIAAPTEEINASWTRLANILLVVTGAITAFFALLIFVVMRLITSPLQELTDAAQELAAKHYNVALDYESEDEVGVLTQAFKEMRDQLKTYFDDLNRRINTDSLTGLPNMRCFFRQVVSERDRMLGEGIQPVMLYVNLIGMKHYNRTYGFDEGDKLLCAIAEILARHFGSSVCCRFSEDHFVAVGDEATYEQELQAVFQEWETANEGRNLPLRIGVYPNRLEDVNASLACDRAKYVCDLYRGSYISGYYVFDEDMLKQFENVRYIINHLDQALEEGWVKVFYQPIIRSATGKVSDEEALSRWVDPTRGLLSPAVFIPVLERARLIYKLDLYVLDRILEKMQMQKSLGLPVVPHSLNLSRVDFDACNIAEEICRRVDAAGIPREKLTIELTESMVGRDFDFMRGQIERLQSLGFRVWLDDFGNGYSSLDVLQDIHFDLLKFDMRFMKRFGEGEESRIILTELVRMARALGIDTVCEGVETPEQMAFLREIGCAKLQGYYFCKAIPFEEIKKRAREGNQLRYDTAEEK